jgi:hypothetical protein
MFKKKPDIVYGFDTATPEKQAEMHQANAATLSDILRPKLQGLINPATGNRNPISSIQKIQTYNKQDAQHRLALHDYRFKKGVFVSDPELVFPGAHASTHHVPPTISRHKLFKAKKLHDAAAAAAAAAAAPAAADAAAAPASSSSSGGKKSYKKSYKKSHKKSHKKGGKKSHKKSHRRRH